MRRFLWKDLAHRPLVAPSFGTLMGMLCGPCKHAVWLLGFGFAGCGLALALRKRTGAYLLLLLSCFLLGLGISAWRAQTHLPAGLTFGATTLEGELEAIESFGEFKRLLLKVSFLPELQQKARFRAMLYAAEPLSLTPGQRLRLKAQLKPPPLARNPGEYNAGPLYQRRGIAFSGSVVQGGVLAQSPPGLFNLKLQEYRQKLDAYAKTLNFGKEATQLYLALSAGLRAELGDELEEAFALSGLAHILSVSGLHVAVLAVAALQFFRWLYLRLPWIFFRQWEAKRVGALFAMPWVWAYVAFTGYQGPAVRSGFMSSLWLLGLLLGGRSDGLSTLALSMLLIVWIEPACVGELSMQLSFLSVAALMLLSPAFGALLSPKQGLAAQLEALSQPNSRLRRLWKYVASTLKITFCASLAATLSSAPLIAGSFHRFNMAGLLSNIVALPLCTALSVLAAVGAALYCLAPPLAIPIIVLGIFCSHLLLQLVDFFANLPGASWIIPGPSAWECLLWFLGLAFFSLSKGRMRWLGLAAPLAACLTLFAGGLPQKEFVLSFLYVGQGDAIFASSRGKHALVDGGGSMGSDTGKRYVLPFLHQHKVRALELAILSHPHADHALGLISTLKHIPTKHLWVTPGLSEKTLPKALIHSAKHTSAQVLVEEVHAGRKPFALGESTWEILSPSPETDFEMEDENDASIVIKIQHGNVSFLLTGDISSGVEKALPLSPATVVKAPHHGSNTSSSEGFIEQLRPRHVVFCVGVHNTFGFPKPEIEKRYLHAKATCHRTDIHGATTFISNGKNVRVKRFLE
ncbi:MAG: DNA internalization-related competence protein ComEC/Rec2 [Cystobacterineae bacterium]|nr:DNA internalization-related competence protein ComEC/Rec2 [Cystobacterineae bacterium]